ncbi:MAG: CoA-binding protein [Flavobacteriales bacterium]
MKTLVLGASENTSRYSNIAIHRLLENGHEVVAVSNKSGEVMGIPFTHVIPDHAIDTVTMYLNPERQAQYECAIINLKPRRVIFNPGSEKPSFEKELLSKGILVENACTLVLLSTDSY